MSDGGLRERLERSVEPFEGERADWDGVLTGVRAAQRRTRLRRLAIVAATLTILVATPAFGIGERLVDVIAGEPAPEEIKSELRRLNDVPEPVLELLGDLSPEVKADEARGVMSLQTTRGPVYLWVAPTEDGGFCAYVEAPTGGGSSACGNDADFGLPRPGLSMDLRPLDARSMTDNRLAFGRIVGWQPGDRVELELDDGRRLPARVVDGWVMRELPVGTTLIRIHLLRGGAIVATQELLPPESPPATPDPDDYRVLLEVRTLTGDTAVLSVAPAPPGQECYRVLSGNSESATCGDLPSGDISVNADLSSALLFGPVQVAAASLEVVFEDGERDDVPFKEGYFLYAVPADHAKRGRLPKEFVARDTAGEVIARAPARPGG